MIDLKEKSQHIAEILKILAHKDRLQILCFLNEKERTVSEIVDFLDISQSQTSQFLLKMKLQKILESQKRWKEIYYKISDKRILKLIQDIKEIYC